MGDKFGLSSAIKYEIRHIGQEKHPVLILDNVLENPEAMIEAACAAEYYVPEHTKYPGLNAPVPEAYCQALVAALRHPIQELFGLPGSILLKYFGFFALATTKAGDAEPIQKIPHHDSPFADRLALVHYLCRAPFRGTGFFRHKATGFESVTVARQTAYIAQAEAELARTPDRDGAYARDGLANYELIDQVDLDFNRLVIYRSNVLHSGLLGQSGFSANPALGRLTANGFIEPAAQEDLSADG